MFTGLIQAVGRIASIESKRGDARVRVDAGALDMSDVKLGDSIAVSGVCLTVVEQAATSFAADVSGETLSCTTFADLRPGDPVNLEKALLPTTRLGGHLVSGHVDGVGRVLERRDDARSIRLRIEAPAALAKYIAAKGSLCVDGVSLTVNAVQGAAFEINIIPHTATQTTVGDYAPGGRVNLEVDILARYLERLMLGEDVPRPESRITRELLERYGFAGLRAED
ncbi:MAG: riboflavin synthase subunit alpha [Candidatus Muproteobacteria bacterium RBG_16_65_34]|uniref:Riboflavin synthase n=1 Tax=Candidatus Muproteobacteria bacterium RBG_16_65_34 TaxID=1817760 RepID=A0A1F6TLQ0_9PROT|nr:MAG: riboflavin synthase subunit alpha [Candidatus Muproteobacteria bacterium RBG_16_65_34]